MTFVKDWNYFYRVKLLYTLKKKENDTGSLLHPSFRLIDGINKKPKITLSIGLESKQAVSWPTQPAREPNNSENNEKSDLPLQSVL